MNTHLNPTDRLARLGALVAAYMCQVKLDNHEVMALAQQAGVLVNTHEGEDDLVGILTKGAVRHTRTIPPGVQERIDALVGDVRH